MKKKNKTAMAMSVAVLTLVLMGTACSDNNNNNSDSTPSASPSLSASPSEAVETEGTAPVVLDATGVYEGLQDNNSIEITTDDGPTAFQITPEVRDQVSPWDSGISVKYQYTEAVEDANGQTQRPTIVTIDKQ